MKQRPKFAILTDSACDMPVELAEQSGVDILCFNLAVDGNSFTERVDFDFDQYYDMLRECEGIPSTSHVTMPRFLEKFEYYDDRDVENLLYVSICGSGSATLDAAKMAREHFYKERKNSRMNITLVDSHAYSMTYGWYVAQVARKLENGAEFGEVVKWLEDKFARSEILLAAYSLKFMKKSGRVSAAAAFAGELLGLRPVISLIDGVSTVRKKVRGDKEVIPALYEYAKEHMDDSMEYMIGGTNDENIAELAKLCEKKFKVKPLCSFKLGAAVATNTGPDAIAIVYLGKKRR